MKKNNIFLKSTLYLIIGGFITRMLGFIIRIVYTRIIGVEGVSIISLVMPTYSMLLNITSFALPVALAKLIAENKNRSIKILSNATVIIVLINLIVITVIYNLSNFIASDLLHSPESKDLINSMCIVFPIISIGSILKGYYNGKQRTLPYMISNVLEQVLRLFLIIIIIPILYRKSVHLAVKGIILLSIITESFSVIILLLFAPKRIKIKKENITPDLLIEKDIMKIALPTVAGRIIGNIGYFFEPIILTHFLLVNSYTKEYILVEYGAYNMYALSILTIPAFLITALSNSIIPEISKHHERNDSRMIKKRIKQTIIPTFFIGIVFSIIILLFRNQFLNLLYNTTKGSEYVLILAPFFPLFYLESIFYSILQASNNSKKVMIISLIGVVIKLITLTILCNCHIGMYAIVVAEIINIICVIAINIIVIKKEKLI